MTVSSTTSRNQYTATSGQTVFPYTFEIFDKDDVAVLQNGTLLSEGTNYTVSGVGNNSGGNITLVVGATAGDVLTIYRDMAYQRLTDYQNSGDFLAQEVNDDFDRLWLAVQQNEQGTDRAIVKPITDSDSISMELPEAAERSGKLLSFTGDGSVSVATSATNGTVSNLVTYSPAGSGAVDTTVEAKLRESVSVKDFGAVGNGTTDDTSAINLALASGAKRVFVPEGTYKITDTISVPSGVKLFGAGKGITVLDGSTTEPSYFFDHPTHIAVGSSALNYTSLPDLASDCDEGDVLVTFASAHGLSQGDVFYISNPTDSSLTNYRTYYRKGQIYQVDRVDSSTVVRVTTPHKFDLVVASVDVYKNTANKGGAVKDLTLLAYPDESTNTVGIKFASERQCSAENVEVIGPHFVGIMMTEGVFDFRVTGCTVLGTMDSPPNDESLQYGIVAGSAAVGIISNNYAVAGRHGIDGGDGSSDVYVCATDVIVDSNVTHSCWRNSISTHGQCLDWVISNNIGSGLVVRGGGHVVTGNKIIQRKDTETEIDYWAISVSELYNPSNVISNNDITVYDSTTNRGCFIDCGGNSDNLDDGTTKEGAFIIEGNRFLLKSGADSLPTQGITFRNRGATGIVIHLIVKNNLFRSEVSNVLEALFVDTVSGDDIFRVDMQSNYCDEFGICRIDNSLNTTIKDNFCISAPRRGIHVFGAVVVVQGNTLRGIADAGILADGSQRTIVIGNEIDDYHKSSSSGTSTNNGAVSAQTDANGTIIVKDNIASDEGASAPAWAWQVYSGGTPDHVYVAGNIDDNGNALRNSAALTVKGPENFSMDIIDGSTRHTLTAPSGVLNIDGLPV